MNKTQFFDEVTQCASQYDSDNQWFGFQRGGPIWSQGTWIQYILAAWKLYQNASNNQLQMILLGDTKIRSDASLLMNFGLAANAKSPQEKEDQQMVADLMAKRRHNALGGRAQSPVEMMGPGSILSAKRWSPLLNDALMLGGIHKKQDFHFALNTDEQAVWARISAKYSGKSFGSSEFDKRRAMFGGAVKSSASTRATEQQAWLEFFHEVPRVLWERGTPRVFVRELLGLKFFGYRPEFTFHQIGFAPSGAMQKSPTFPNYLAGLNNAGLPSANRTLLLRELGEFLFNDANALAKVGA